MIIARILASISVAAVVVSGALAQGTTPPVASKAQPSAVTKDVKTPSNSSSKASADPTKVDLGKQEKDKLKAAAREACRQRCAQEFPVAATKKTTSPKSADDPCKGLPTVNGAYQNCVAEKMKKPSPEATASVGGAVISALNKPKYEACMKKCDRGL